LILTSAKLRSNLGQVVYTYMPLSPSSITWYLSKDGDVFGREGDHRPGGTRNGRLPLWDDLKSQLRAYCLDTGISSGLNAWIFVFCCRFKYTSQQFERFICQIRQLAECNILDSTTFFPFLASLPLPRVSILSSSSSSTTSSSDGSSSNSSSSSSTASYRC